MNLLHTCTMMSVSVHVPVSLFHRKILQILQIQQKTVLCEYRLSMLLSWQSTLPNWAYFLVFCCRSSPRIFDTLSEALCWILYNICKLPFVLQLLDDFLVVDFPSSPPARSISIAKSLFHELDVPLSEEKTIGPWTRLKLRRARLGKSLIPTAIAALNSRPCWSVCPLLCCNISCHCCYCCYVCLFVGVYVVSVVVWDV